MEMRNPNDQEKDGRLTTVILDGEDVSWKIRTEEISAGSSKVAALPEVRKVLVKKQQEIAKGQNVIMEGRDITYRVLPDAQLKIYLTANDMVRAERRHLQLQMRGVDVSFEEIFKDTLERDQRDMGRSADPLQITADAWVVDTTDVAIEKVVEMIVAKVNVLRGT
jgi:cytidylate kinase